MLSALPNEQRNRGTEEQISTERDRGTDKPTCGFFKREKREEKEERKKERITLIIRRDLDVPPVSVLGRRAFVARYKLVLPYVATQHGGEGLVQVPLGEEERRKKGGRKEAEMRQK